MDDERQGRAAVLIGREKDLEILHSLIERTEGTGPQGPVLMLRGDAGVGKTALLKATADRAAEAGFRVLWVSGAEDEVDLEFAALQQLSWFLRDRLDGLDAYERDVLGRALGRIERAGQFAPARLAVSAAALSLVDAAVESAPLLLVIDDAQWIDPASA
jgi:predicted ATPase